MAFAIVVPVCSGLLAFRESSALRAGRCVAAGCGVASLAAVGLFAAVAQRSSGRVGDGGWLDLSVDRVSSFLLVVVLATAAMVASFSRRSLDADGRVGRYFLLLGVVVSGSALVVVPGAGWLLLVGWVASGWALAGLTGFAAPWDRARLAQRRIMATLVVGDVALLVAVVIVTTASDAAFTSDAGTVVADLQASTVGSVTMLDLFAVALVVAGAARSALFPFHRWLVGTLVAPTPISALIHAGFVSGAGLLLIRFAPAFVASDVAVILAFALGIVTVVLASATSLARPDVKGALAWSTVSQMAFMVIQCAVGAFSSAAFHIAGHGMYKAALFLGAGDTVSARLRSQRRPRPVRLLSASALWAVTLTVPTLAVGAAVWAIPLDVSDAGRVLVVVFAWLSAVFSLHGWLVRGSMNPLPSALAGSMAVVAGVGAYVGGLRLVEDFLKPSLPTGTSGTIIGPGVLVAIIALLAVGTAAVVAPTGSTGATIRTAARRRVEAWSSLSPTFTPTRSPSAPMVITASNDRRRAEVRAELAQAAAIVAPLWPLSSFVAVNPLGGLESLDFDDAAATARRWLGGRTHLSLAEFRDDHHRGITTDDDLEYAVLMRYGRVCSGGPVPLAGRLVDPVDLVTADLLHGPDLETVPLPRTALDRVGPRDEKLAGQIDDIVSSWLAEHSSPPAWPSRRPGESFLAMSLRLTQTDPRLARIVDAPALRWIADLEDDAAAVIIAAFAAAGVGDEDRVDEMRGHLSRLVGWAGLAKWRNEWAQPDELHPDLAPIEIVAVRAVLEAAVLSSVAPGNEPAPRPEDRDDALLAARVAAVASVVAPMAGEDDRAAIAAVLAHVPAPTRASAWLEAQERCIDQGLLSLLDRVDAGPTVARPDAQVVLCIDVRSEGLRRHLEANGNVETFGFAGFFGVPMRVQRLGWERAEARCPVLVAPAIGAVEEARPECSTAVGAQLARQRALDGARHAHREAKHGPGAPFVLAETAGWALGPSAMARTWLPGAVRPVEAPATTLRFDADGGSVEQLVFFAEAVLNTMGLVDRFAPLVVLCGHTSVTTNNPHATALECGACAGASGDSNARAVAALLNDPEIRTNLVERGITIPDDTWFVAGLHDTASDHVTLLDLEDAPPALEPVVDDLRAQLDEAGRRQSDARARQLPGSARRVRDRGADWAQVRPEWGLARNAAFIIGPRSMTAGLDLNGRAFLHTYDAELDPEGRVLETIMTAPLVVGHWISAQYYFSTVDPEVFGAGDKLLHNPIGTTGVISGDAGDLRVGLPLQSTHLDGRRHHQPVRLLAVIQADLVRIESIIASNSILQTLTGGSWLRIAGRSHPHEPWSTRTPDGTWMTVPRPFDGSDSLVEHLTTEHT
ncbi:MAG TPA: putative inorganic carbon transporter subunit DabA [Acidimicrobiales bacterium]|nr:putative inorganic carbon transporter subunit DabA [Acidimicrobiales bacterium]